MSDEALEPGLTAYDKRVLRAIDDVAKGADKVRACTVWWIAERMAIKPSEFQELHQTLLGLSHLGYIADTSHGSLKRRVYYRTVKGDKALA